MALQGSSPVGQVEGNELAASTLAIVDRVRPHVGIISLAIVVIFAVVAGIVVVRSQESAERVAGWDALFGAFADGEPGRIEEVASRYRGSEAGWWAELIVADGALADGNRLLTVDRGQAQSRLEAAAALYTSVNSQRPTGLAAERGVFGLARTRESQGQLAEARRGYEALVEEYPYSPLRALAEARLGALKRPATEQWYKWFETPPAVPAAPPAEPGSDKPTEPAAEPAKPAGDAAPEPAAPGSDPARSPGDKSPAEPPAG